MSGAIKMDWALAPGDEDYQGRHLEASFQLVDRHNAGLGYQVCIVDSYGYPVLDTRCDPASGDPLLTPTDCIKVLEYYKEAP